MKLANQLWFKIVLCIMFIMYTVTLIPYIMAWNSVTYHLGVYGIVFFICYLMILISIGMMLRGFKMGYYIFLGASALIPVIYLLQGTNFSLEQAILRPVIFCGLVALGVNSKK